MNYNTGKNHPKFVDLTGKTSGDLFILEYVLIKEKTQNVWKWKCLCSCGKYTYTRTRDFLKTNPVKSCKSCAKKRLDISRILPDNLSQKNRIYRVYKKGAEKRGYSFELSYDEVISLINQSCHYCGTLPEKDERNGIDRKNNKLGYFKENVVPCCKICNKMKMDLDYNIFLSQISKCYINLNK